MVFYRKYRPRSFEELVGQEHVKANLISAFQGDKLAHAYLFTGPRGTGKTSTARILAKVVNCESKTPPCNLCPICLSIDDGSNLDLIEIDAASNRGIEDIRTLREGIKLAPSKFKKKVYIIDEVHMLTTEAFNALLKTLEEPPSHALFILATTDAQKIPATILSRVQRLDFKLATNSEIKQLLTKVIKAEGLAVADEVIELLAKKAQGSFRDGEKLLDQISTLPKLDLKSLEGSLNSSSFETAVQILSNISSHDPKSALNLLATELMRGVAVKELTLGLLDNLRSIILIKYDLGESLVKVEVGDDEYRQLVQLARKFNLDQLIKTVDSLQSSLEKLRYSSIQSLPLEVALIESCGNNNGMTQNNSDDQNLRQSDLQSIRSSGSPSLSGISEQPGPRESKIDPDPPTISDSPDIAKISEKWGYILETAKSYNYSLEALLRSAKIGSVEKKLVIIEVPYSFHQRMLEAPKSKDLLESILSDVLGRVITISTIIGQRPQRNEDIANIEVAADDELVRLAAEIFSSDSVN